MRICLQVYNGVSALGFGLIIGFVTAFKQGIRGVRRFKQAHADAQGDLSVMQDAEFLLNPLRNGQQRGGRRIAGDDDEFIPAKAAREIEPFAQHAPQELTQFFERSVAAVVAVGVVEDLELVECIEKMSPSGVSVRRDLDSSRSSRGLEMMAVEDLGRVEQGLLLILRSSLRMVEMLRPTMRP